MSIFFSSQKLAETRERESQLLECATLLLAAPQWERGLSAQGSILTAASQFLISFGGIPNIIREFGSQTDPYCCYTLEMMNIFLRYRIMASS